MGAKRNQKKKKIKNDLFKKRNDILSESYEIDAEEVKDILPDFTSGFRRNQEDKLKLVNSQIFKGFKGVRNERIKNINLNEPKYGNVYETNLPEQAYTFEYPSESEGVFNPLQMHLTGRANYERLKRGGTMAITQAPKKFSTSKFVKNFKR